MGKGKRSSGTSYVSKGIVGTTKSRSKQDPDYPALRMMNQLKAYQAGKNVVLTIPNPNPNETNKRFIKVNARDVWRSVRR
jgi:hypothetical protein